MKHIFLINTYTVGKETDNLINKIKQVCNKFNIEYEIEVNGAECSTEDILKKYKKNNYIILPVGGDGILNRTLNKIALTNNILGFVPYGTGNDFYRSCKLQYKDKINKCDLIKINNKYFINTACFGIDAEVGNNTVKSKIFSKKQKYNLALIKTFFKYRPKELEIKINNKTIKDKFTTIVVCNGMYYGSGYNISPSSKLDDKLINVYIAKKLNKINLIKLILKIKNGTHENCQMVEKYETNKLRIKSKQILNCNIDGEELESKTFDIEYIKQINLYYNEKLINEIIK